MTRSSAIFRLALSASVLLLAVAACGGEAAREASTTTAPTTTAPTATTSVATTTTASPTATTSVTEPAPPEFAAGPLGAVRVAPGGEIQIRSLEDFSGRGMVWGLQNRNGAALAVEHYGPIMGRTVNLEFIDEGCTMEGGRAGAEQIAADPQVAGVIGATCSAAAVAASPILSGAGMSMISAINNSPYLTSDLQGNPGEHYHPGYYRVSHNDLYQSHAVADFLINALGLNRAAVIHDGDAATGGLANAFVDSFTARGGRITSFNHANRGDTDLLPLLTEAAAGSPQALFLALWTSEATHAVRQIGEVPGLKNTAIIGTYDQRLNDDMLSLPETEGMYFTGPDLRLGNSRNQHTGRSADEAHAEYEAEFGPSPDPPTWLYAYDAVTMLLSAIEETAAERDGALYIDRAELRDVLDATRFEGVVGEVHCEEFGDCGTDLFDIIHHTHPSDLVASRGNVVFAYDPFHEIPGRMVPGGFDLVEIPGGGEIQIRAMLSVGGDFAYLGIPQYRIAQLAVDDYGPILGHSVNLGEVVDSMCSPEGGAAGAAAVIAEPQVVGVIGTSCSGAAAAAMPALSEAGLSMVSSGNTSPTLTSDLAGGIGSDHYRGYYRTSHNDLHEGLAVAEFVNRELQLDAAAVVHEGDVYSRGLAGAFADAFTGLGGEVAVVASFDGDPDELRPTLEEMAALAPDVLFFPYYDPRGDAYVQQSQGMAGLRDTVFIGYGSGVGEEYDIPADRTLYLTIPDQRFGDARHEITGRSADEIQTAYLNLYGEVPGDAFWAHAYDAAVMLLHSIDAVAVKQGDSLFINRTGLRAALDAVNLGGVTGHLVCDDFGDCAAPRIIVVDAKLSGSAALLDNVVFSYRP